MKFEKQNPLKSEHPYPVDAMNLMIKLEHKGTIPLEDLCILAELIQKYQELREVVFHEI